MSVKCVDIINIMEELAPIKLAEAWDNPGLLAGNPEAEVKKILVALDATEEVINEAITIGADIIVTHHPVLFSAIKSVTTQNPIGIKLYKLIQNNIGVYSAHTNLDVAFGGTNDVLAEMAGLENIKVLSPTFTDENGKCFGIGRIGEVNKTTFLEFSERLKHKLDLDCLRVVGDLNKIIKTVGLCTGSGFEYMEEAYSLGADVYITADLRFHEAQKALDMGMCIIDATHYASENIIVPVICRHLNKRISEKNMSAEVFESKVDGQTFRHI